MNIYNADGSQAEMCGNGIRCVAKYVYDYGLTDKDRDFSRNISRNQISSVAGREWKGRKC